MNAPATRAPAHLDDSLSTLPPALSTLGASLSTDLESRAIAMLDDEQAFASFGRWMEVVNAAKRARSLREQLGVEEYVAAIYREIPA